MKKFTEPEKNTISDTEVKKDTFEAFINHFKPIKKVDNTFFAWDNRNVDYNVLSDAAKKVGIKSIPSKEELQNLV